MLIPSFVLLQENQSIVLSINVINQTMEFIVHSSCPWKSDRVLTHTFLPEKQTLSKVPARNMD